MQLSRKINPNKEVFITQLLNTDYIFDLYRELIINGKKMAILDIYRKHPDYQLDFDNNEGVVCLDDVARAVILFCIIYKKKPNLHLAHKTKMLLNFILFCNVDNQFFCNFMLEDGSLNLAHINSKPSPNFWTWRAFAALSMIVMSNINLNVEIRVRINIIINNLMLWLRQFVIANSDIVEYEGVFIPEFVAHLGGDQLAVILLALNNLKDYSEIEDNQELMINIANGLLMSQYGDFYNPPYSAFLSWKNTWHAWGNNQAYSLLKVSKVLNDDNLKNAGLKEIKNFYTRLLRKGFIRDFEVKKENTATFCMEQNNFPQIAYDIRPMVWACAEAWKQTKNERYALLGANIYLWFLGRNIASTQMYCLNSGRCFDGIDSMNSINLNCGAESAIEAQLAAFAIDNCEPMKKIVVNYLHNKKS